MDNKSLGIIVEYYRKKEKLPLEKVSKGICSKATLQRIELGDKLVDSLMGDRLLGRLGREEARFELIQDEEDYELWCLRNEIDNAMQQKEYDLAKKLIQEYQVCTEQKHMLHKQYVLEQEVMLEIQTNKDAELIIEKAKEALLISIPSFERVDAQKLLYSQTEIELILILIHYGYMEFGEETEWELQKLLDYVERMFEGQKKEQLSVRVVEELIYIASAQHDDEKIISYIEQAIDILAQGRTIRKIASLRFYKAQILRRMYGTQEDKISEIKQECLMAYAVSEVMGMVGLSEEIERFCEEKLQWRVTELVM